MDFIETLFGISPDGGNGSLEVLYVSAFTFILAALVFRGRIVRLIRRKD
ncbi:MAG TPA: hypothetical protein VKP66_13830 [Steroidobacteraceae bacterium]|nr:hypothetical protein [Steroidobacteraceae bacterium]